MRNNKDCLLITLSVLIPVLCFSCYMIAFYPGMMTQDSIDQWEQIITWKLNNWHPVIHTLFDYLCTRVWYSPASVAIAQILILALVFSCGIRALYKMGVSKTIIIITIILFSIYPTNGFMSVTLWKDILYSAMLLWMTVILMNIARTQGEWIKSKRNLLIFIFNSFGVMFFRHNGILTFICVMLSLGIIFRKYFKYWSILTIGILVVYFIITGPVYKAMNVVQAASTEAMGIPMQQIAAVIKFNGNMTEEQAAFFNKVIPEKVWREEYHPYITNPLKFHKDFNYQFLIENKIKFFKNWAAVVKQNPDIALTAFLKQTSMIWKVKPLKDSFTYTITPGIIENNLGLKTIIINKQATNYAMKIFEFTNKEDRFIIFWRPALWLYVSLIAGIIVAGIFDIKFLLVLVPMVSNALGFMLATPSQDYRYQYANVLIASILLPLAVHMLIQRLLAKNVIINE